MKSFGSFLKKHRIKKKLTLRKFCLINGFDPGNYSKLERNILSAPRDEKKLKKYSECLSLNSEEYETLLDLAKMSNNSLNIKNKSLLNYLPVLIRRLDKKEFTGKKLEELLKFIDRNRI